MAKSAAQAAWEKQKKKWGLEDDSLSSASSTENLTAAEAAFQKYKDSDDYDAEPGKKATKSQPSISEEQINKTQKKDTASATVATPDNICATGRTNAGSAQQRQEEADSRALVRQMQEKSGVIPTVEDNRPEAKTTGRIQKPDPAHYDATQIQQYKQQEISDYKKVLDEQNAFAERQYQAVEEAAEAVKKATGEYARNRTDETYRKYSEAYTEYEKAVNALQEAAVRSTELANEVNTLTTAYQKEYDDATRYAGKDYSGMQSYIWMLEEKHGQAQDGQKTASGQDLKEFYEQEIDRARKYSYGLASAEELQAEYDRLTGSAASTTISDNSERKKEADEIGSLIRLVQKAMNDREAADAKTAYETYAKGKERRDTFGQYGNGNIDLTAAPSLESVSASVDGVEMLLPMVWVEGGRIVRAKDEAEAIAHYRRTGETFGRFGSKEEAEAYGKKLLSTQGGENVSRPEYDLADKWLVGIFREQVSGEKTQPALADEVEMANLPDEAKEVLLTLMESGDYEAAANYYAAYEPVMTANYAAKQYAKVKDWASQNFGTAALATLASGVTGVVTPAMAWVDNAFNAINNKLVDATGRGEYRFSDTNSDAYQGARLTAALQEGTRVYNATTGKLEGALNLASGALSSAEQNVIQFALFGSASLPFMAASAAGQSTYQSLKGGAAEEHAAVTGTVSGLIEYMTEKLPLDHLLEKLHKIESGGAVSVAEIAKMIRAQGLEEASEEVVGNIADNLFDMHYNGENSEFQQYSAQLQREGMSEAAANQAAFGKFFIGDSVEAAAAAYLSTFLLVGGNAVTANVQAAQIGKEMKTGALYEGTDGQTQYTQKEIETLKLAQQIPDSYEGGRYAAEKLKAQVLEGKKLSNRLLGVAAITSNQAYADAARYVEQGLGMGQETMSFKLAAAIAETHKEGAAIPSDALMDTLKNQIETDRVNKATAEHNEGKGADTATTLSQYQTFLVKNGLSLKDAKNRTEVLNRLILGQDVSDRELRSIRMSAKLTKQVLQEVAGVEIPAGVTKEKDLMRYYRSAHESFQQKGKAEAAARTAQDAQDTAARMAEQAEAVQKIMQEEQAAAKSNVDERLQYFFEHGRTQPMAEQTATQAETAKTETASAADTQQSARAQETAPESTASAAPGLVRDEYVQTSVDAKTAEKIDTVAKALGVTVKFADEVAGGEANAQITGAEVLIEKGNPNPLMFLLGHELTHRIQDLSPEQYQNFKAAIMDEIRPQAEAIVALYASRGRSITMEAALDEAAADYAGRMLDDGTVLDEFIEKNRDNRTLLQKIVDALRSLIQKLTGAERRKAETAEGKLLAALEAASKQASSLQQETNDATMGEARSSAKYWRPNLTQNEWTILNRHMEQEIGDTAHTLDETTKWAYADEKGVRVFALYGVGDGTEATPLYAVGGEQAKTNYQALMNKVGGSKNGTVSNGTDIGRWIDSVRRNPIYGSSDSNASGQSGTSSKETDRLYGGASGSNTTGIAGTGIGTGRGKVTNTEADNGTQAPNVSRNNPDIRYSLKGKTADGVEVYETSKEVREMPYKQRMDTFMDIMRSEYAGRTAKFTANDGEVYYARFSDADLKKNLYGDKKSDRSGWNAKIRSGADGDIFNLVENAQHHHGKTESGKTSAAHNDVTGWEYFVKTVQIDGQVYDLLANVRKKPDGEYVYSVQLNRNKNKAPAPPVMYANTDTNVTGDSTLKRVPTNASGNSISSEAEIVNPGISGNEQNGRASAKGAEISREYADILKENELLREKVEYWKGQTKRTDRATTDQKAVAKEARSLIERYGAELDAGDIQADLQNLYDFIASGTDGANELTGEEAFRRAREIAGKLVENAVEQNDELYRDYADLRNFLRTTKLTISEEESRDFADWNEFRKENFGRLQVGRGETNIDQVYQELAELWPEFFDESEYLTPADQLQQIADVAGRLYTITESNPFSGYMEQAKTAAANEILEDFFDLPQTKKTFADRQAEKLAEAKAKGQQRVADVRAQKNEQLARLKEQNRVRVEDILNRERTRRKKEVGKLKADYEARTETAKEKRSARELRNKITRHAKTLSDRLLRPTDAKHIPEALRTPLAAVLEAINQEDAYTIKLGTEYRNALKHGGEGALRGEQIRGDGYRMKGLLTDRTAAFLDLKGQYTKIANEAGSEITIDPELLGDAADGFQNSFDAVIAMRDTPIAEMTKGQLQTVWNVLRAVEHSVSQAGKVFSKAKYTKTQEWAEAMQNATKHRRERYAPFNTTLTLDFENPLTFFSHYGEAGKAIYRMLRDAQDQQQLMVTEVTEKVQKLVDEKTVNALEKEAHAFTLESGEALTLTTAQIMDLYNLMQREQAKLHLTVGGIMQPEVKAGKTKVRRGTEAVRLTESDLKTITETLTPEQRKIADGLQALTAGMLAEFGNEASMKAYGYRKFTERNYWPIRSAGESVHSNVEKNGTQARSIKNIGMAKATTAGADNALDISSVFETFADHAADMTDYAAWLCPMEDANHLFNYSAKDADGRVSWTVKGLLDRYGGNGAQRYWKKLMEDIQNGIKTKEYSPVTNLASKAISGFKGAAVGGNIRVVIQQPTAFFRAAAVLSPVDLSCGMVKGVTKGNGWKKALEYSPIAQRKDNGGFDISAPYSMYQTLFDGRSALSKFNDALSAPAGIADAVTWGKIWNACEYTVARNYKSLTPGSKAFYEQVAKQFAEVIDQTQVVDGVLQRANVMRAKSEIAKQATSFKGEPLMSLNLLIRSFQEARYAKDGKSRARATGHLARAGFALAVTAGINALAQSLIDAIRDDDPDKKYWQRFMSAFTGIEGDETSGWEKVWNVYSGNLADGLIIVDDAPYISDIASMIQGYEVARQDTEIINDIINAGENFVKSMDGTGSKTRAYTIKQLFGATAKLFAVPVNNLTRDVWGVARSFAIERDNLPMQYEMEKAIYNLDNSGNAGRFSDLMYKALRRGEDDTFQRIKTDLMEHMEKTEEEIKSALKSRVRDDYIDLKFTSEEAAEFLVEHGLEDDEFEAFWTIQKWDNRKNEGWTKTKELGDTVLNGGVSPTGMTLDEVVDFYVEHGMEIGDVQSAITGFIHEAFDADELDVEMAQDLLYQYQAYDKDEEGYKSEDDVYWTVQEWVAQYNGDEDYRKYGELGEAVTAGKDIENLLKQYEAHGADAEDKITSELHKAWKDGELSDKDAVRRLIQYEKVDEEIDAEYKVYTWKIGGELSTVYKNGEIKKKDAIAALIKYEKADDQLEAEYTIYEWDLGSELSTAYKEGKVTEKEATKALLKYGKAKDEDDAYWKIRKWEGGEGYGKYDKFTSAVESGKNLSETISYYKAHGVTEETLKRQITTYFKPLYLEASVHERQYMKEYLLDAFEALGVKRSEESKRIDKWLEE